MRTSPQLCIQLATVCRSLLRLLALGFLGFSAPIHAATPQEIFKLASPSVVVVEAPGDSNEHNALGSGVVIEPGVIATNCHVIENAREISVRKGSDIWRATVSVADRAYDVCQLNVPDLPLNPVEIRSIQDVEVGETVYAIGNPHGFELTLSAGLISSIRNLKGFTYLQTTAPMDEGSSGGGLFDAAGRLIGITTFTVRNSQNLNFALPVDAYLEAARRQREKLAEQERDKLAKTDEQKKLAEKENKHAEQKLKQ